MAPYALKSLFLLTALTAVRAYFLMGMENFITTERIDPIANPGQIASHVHVVAGGSNFRMSTNTSFLRASQCTSSPIAEDNSAYWFPKLYFQWANGSFSDVEGGMVVYYLYSNNPGTTTPFPDNFRMISGSPKLRSYDPNSFAQRAVTFLCLDFNGVTTRHNSIPNKMCPSGIRSQINFQSCWDGKNVDSPDHQSHVSYLSNGPDSGTCTDPKFPITLPRIFTEIYWGTGYFDKFRSQAMNQAQPFVFAHGDPTGYGYHGDYFMGWNSGVLQNVVDKCHCNNFGDAQCCADQGIFTLKHGQNCRITRAIDETTLGTIPKLPGNNPVRPEGPPADILPDSNLPSLVLPIFAYTGQSPTAVGTPVGPAPTPSSTRIQQVQSLPPSSSATQAIHTPSPSTSGVPIPPSSIRPPGSSSSHTSTTRSVVLIGSPSSKSASPQHSSKPAPPQNSPTMCSVPKVRYSHHHKARHMGSHAHDQTF